MVFKINANGLKSFLKKGVKVNKTNPGICYLKRKYMNQKTENKMIEIYICTPTHTCMGKYTTFTQVCTHIQILNIHK